MFFQRKKNSCEYTRLIGKLSASIMKEMVLAHSSYARAAGLQSEINKVTVTRVAGSEVEYKRQLNLYKKDMLLSVNEIKREQLRLRKSIRRYSNKMRQGRIERQKRERESYELDKKTAENMSRIAAIFMMGEMPVKILKINRQEKDVSIDSGIDDEDAVNDKCDKHIKEETEEDGMKEQDSGLPRVVVGTEDSGLPRVVVSTEDHNPSTGTHLPSIIEEDGKDEDDAVEVGIHEDTTYNLSSQSQSPQNEILDTINIQLRSLKPKKQVVSFADIIKLQHTTNTKKLFNLVNLLAKQHGIGEKEEEKESRNSSVNRGSTEDSSASLRAASVLYPMKFGYSSQESDLTLPPIDGVVSDTEDTGSPDLSADDKSDPSDRKSESRSRKSDLRSPQDPKSEGRDSPLQSRDKRDVHSAKKLKNRNKSLPVLIDDFQRMKLEQAHRAMQMEESRRYSVVGSSGSHGRPRVLPPLQKQPSEGTFTKSRDRSGSITWAEAFGLLKGVHSLQSSDEF